jgi:glycosyltransferase involved in cell wall biosynthesis
MQSFDEQEPPSPDAGGGAPVSGNMIGGKSGGGDPPLSVETGASSPATASDVELPPSTAGTPPASSESGGLPGNGLEEPAPPPAAPSGLDPVFSNDGEPVVFPEAQPKQRATSSGTGQHQRNLIRSYLAPLFPVGIERRAKGRSVFRLRRPRIMHVVVAGDIGGAERLLVDLATRPDRTRAEHQIALLTPNPSLLAYFERAGVRVHDRGIVRENPFAYLWRSLGPSDVSWLARTIDEERAEVVHTHTFGSHVLGTRAALRTGRPQIRTEHHVGHYFDASTSLFTRWAAARTERFVAVSEYVRRVIAGAAPRIGGRTRVVRNGVDTDYWSPRPRKDRGFRIGVVCRLTAWKRVNLVIEAAAAARAELWVIGDGEERARLEAVARRRGAAVRFVGHQLDPRALVAECDAVMSAADREPLGLSLLESLSMERPVLAVDGGGIREIVQHDVTGLVVGAPTVAALAEAIVQARSNPEGLARMGAAGRRFVLRECGVDAMCEGYASVYEEPRSA